MRLEPKAGCKAYLQHVIEHIKQPSISLAQYERIESYGLGLWLTTNTSACPFGGTEWHRASLSDKGSREIRAGGIVVFHTSYSSPTYTMQPSGVFSSLPTVFQSVKGPNPRVKNNIGRY